MAVTFSPIAIPHVYQHKVLMAGILSAIIMRIALILAGVSLLESFHWMIYIFGGLLLFTAIRMLMQKKEEQDKKKMAIEKNIAVRVMKKFFPISFELNNNKFFYAKIIVIKFCMPHPPLPSISERFAILLEHS